MQNVKPWYTSKTIWGSIVAVLSIAASAVGFDLDGEARAQTVEAILQLIAAGGALVAVFGRIVATEMVE